MNDIKIELNISPKDKYEKAKLDLMQALKTYEELSASDKERLVNEIFGAANVAVVCNILTQLGRR